MTTCASRPSTPRGAAPPGSASSPSARSTPNGARALQPGEARVASPDLRRPRSRASAPGRVAAWTCGSSAIPIGPCEYVAGRWPSRKRSRTRPRWHTPSTTASYASATARRGRWSRHGRERLARLAAEQRLALQEATAMVARGWVLRDRTGRGAASRSCAGAWRLPSGWVCICSSPTTGACWRRSVCRRRGALALELVEDATALREQRASYISGTRNCCALKGTLLARLSPGPIRTKRRIATRRPWWSRETRGRSRSNCAPPRASPGHGATTAGAVRPAISWPGLRLVHGGVRYARPAGGEGAARRAAMSRGLTAPSSLRRPAGSLR